MGESGVVSPRAGVGRALSAVGSILIDVVYPPRCAGCGRRGRWVCAACDTALPRFAPPWCDRCGVPISLGPCRCPDLEPDVLQVRSAAGFDGWLRPAILSFKYQEERARDEHLGDVLAGVLVGLGTIDALVPVPLHPTRLRQRGYNQSALLARRAGRALGIPVLDAVRRLRPTPQQVGLGADARRANVAGAFAAGGELSGARLVIVDDVITTGSTLGACAIALRSSGALEVRGASLAREL